MPQAKFTWLPPTAILTYEEILRTCRILATMGVRKIRLTGGEPLVRRDLTTLVAQLFAITEIQEVCLTTNAVALKDHAETLYQAGLRHVNISLDCLRRERYAAITGRDQFPKVWSGIERALELGFSPIKINTVVMKGVNDDEIVPLAALTVDNAFQVRFIEFMPVGQDCYWTAERFISSGEVLQKVEAALGSLFPLPRAEDSGPASIYRLAGARGEVGFISPLSHNFCRTCNRLRLTADGRLRLCLFSDQEADLRAVLRGDVSDTDLAQFLRQVVTQKPPGYQSTGAGLPSCTRHMASIGG